MLNTLIPFRPPRVISAATDVVIIATITPQVEAGGELAIFYLSAGALGSVVISTTLFLLYSILVGVGYFLVGK